MLDKLKAWLRGERKHTINKTAKPVRGRVDPTDKRGGPRRAASAKVNATIKVNRVYSKKLNRWFTVEEYRKLTGAQHG